MLRYISIFLVLVAVLAFSVLPASAAVLDYNDYITDVVVDGDHDLVTVSFPVAGDTHYTLFRKVNGSYVADRQSVASAVNYMLYPGEVYAFQFIPLSADTISLKDIPNGTRISVDVDFSFDSDLAYNTPYLSNYVRFYNSSGVQIGDELFNYGAQAPAYMFPSQFFLNKPSDSSAFTCTFVINDFSFAAAGDVATSVFIHVKSYTMTMTISSLLRLQQESGRTNEILKAVEDKLADQGQTLEDVLGAQQDTNEKLDDIINGTVSPDPPSGSDIVGDLDDAESEIRDEASSGLQQGEAVQQNALQVLGIYLSAFACVSWIFDKFATIPFFSGLLSLSFSLGICGAILGLGFSFASRFSSERRGKYESKSKTYKG